MPFLTDPAADVRHRAIAATGAIGDRQAVSRPDRAGRQARDGLRRGDGPRGNIRYSCLAGLSSRCDLKTMSCARRRPRRSAGCGSRRRCCLISLPSATSFSGGLARAQVHFRRHRTHLHLERAGTISHQGWAQAWPLKSRSSFRPDSRDWGARRYLEDRQSGRP